MDLSIIIVNWSSIDFLIECLKSIRSQQTKISYEVVVIDNASFDGSGDIIRQQFEWVNFIQSEENLGYARANNEAFRKSSGSIILFLNPDTVLEKNTLTSLIGHMARNPEAGALGCRLLNTDGTLQYYCIQKFPSLFNQIFSSHWIIEKCLNKYHNNLDCDPIPVDCVSGACLMVRREVFEKIGCFSEDYFMYSEDVDLCRKIWNSGYKVLYCKDVSVFHHGGKSTHQKEKKVSSFPYLMMMESRYRYFLKFNGWLYAITYRILMIPNSMFRFIFFYLLLCIPFSSHREEFQPKAMKWRSIFLWCTGLLRASI